MIKKMIIASSLLAASSLSWGYTTVTFDNPKVATLQGSTLPFLNTPTSTLQWCLEKGYDHGYPQSTKTLPFGSYAVYNKWGYGYWWETYHSGSGQPARIVTQAVCEDR